MTDIGGTEFSEFDPTSEPVPSTGTAGGPPPSGLEGGPSEGSPPPDAEVAMQSIEGLSTSGEELASVVQARDELESQLMGDTPQQAYAAGQYGGEDYEAGGFANVVGVGIGEKEVGGFPTGRLAVKVLVKDKLSAARISSEAVIPSSVGGVMTDVDPSGEIYAQVVSGRFRPAPCGVSIGHCGAIMAGTLGCLVVRGSDLFILSNNHVIARVNQGPIGAKIPQPGRLDGGVCDADVIAQLTDYRYMFPSSTGLFNDVDAAIARTSSSLVDRRILRPWGWRQAMAPNIHDVFLNMQVQKSGRTTGWRRGYVDLVNTTVTVDYSPQGPPASFRGQFRVRGLNGQLFSDRGDSGSIVTTYPENRPTGLLFAGNSGTNTTFCNNARRVVETFNCLILVGG